ncbi:unnamed protein product [Linum trigynum]|uniref:DJ-1/PfpI domain-containing protein n=1 Tax=Linum trigynum TaxID=586398 RepID=A0AAV2CKL8_9ROSI
MGSLAQTELKGHFFTVNANFEQVKANWYDCILIPGWMFMELLSADHKVVGLVRKFAEAGKPVVTSCEWD